MTSEHRDGWTPFWVIFNTLATVFGTLLALAIAIVALLRTG